jgi:hypothetical protein
MLPSSNTGSPSPRSAIAAVGRQSEQDDRHTAVALDVFQACVVQP